ncbi:MAG: hypothetical protein AAFY60_17055, partial [Myxococcota bacterium]
LKHPDLGSMFLGNGFHEFSTVPRRHRQTVVEKFAQVFLSVNGQEYPDWEVAKPNLRPLVRHEDRYGLLRVLDAMEDRKEDSDVPLPFVGALVGAIALDTENAVHELLRVPEGWDVDREEMWRVAIDNLRYHSSTPLEAIAPGVYIGSWEDGYESSRMLIPEILYRVELEGAPVVMVPGNDAIIVTGDRSEEGLAAMANAVLNVDPQRPLSRCVYRHVDGQWQVWEPDSEYPDLVDFAQLRVAEIHGSYDEQKHYLDQLYEKRGEDVLVATAMVVENDETGVQTLCSWGAGVDSILPQTDLVVIGCVGRERTLVVPWAIALAQLGELMEPVEGLVPVRFRVRHSPTEDQFEALATQPGVSAL